MISLSKHKKIINKILIVVVIILVPLIYIKIAPVKTLVDILLISFIFAYGLKPISNNVSEKFNLKKRTSSIIIIVAIVVITVMLLYLMIPAIIKESSNFGAMMDNIELYINDIARKLKIDDLPIFNSLYMQINEKINIFLGGFSNNFLENIISASENIISCAIIPIVTYYFLVDGELIYNKILLILPTRKRIVAKKILSNIDKILSRYIISQLFLSLIIGVLTFIILILVGVKFALVLAILNGVFNIIPYFGPIIGGVPAVFVALIDSPSKAIWTIIVMFILQQLEGNILSPKITGDSTNMHPIIIIILLLIGEMFGGLVGMILAVPIGVIIKVIYEDANYYLF
ncbi:AI-2E family transporter [Clostridium gasigenes]|uniref:AI-2E family transporter n=1 Tax=Clostridium gasigenes TaxID=94869 RepID=A0A7X0VRA8_9CLOT|nr:AI-2E family transporter [Clostridium gasigenes]MBB6623059.1 AI-2E family transporter [Clostridium gasigenes]MBB6715187.1 AI-2E family transporter [Clostridium gasigenes]MBU3087829.1 AI-2E family transporter [Clostridium gasigenes]MBU3107266.1 AI-2E family transporter [Clostridium gasigenes]MBU3132532.1 AI-2E family transporter [Clostridium gasigenes]